MSPEGNADLETEEKRKWWLEEHYGDLKPEKQVENPIDPKIKAAIDFIKKGFFEECEYIFLGVHCLDVWSLMEKFSVNKEDQGLLIQSLLELEKLKNYHKFDHPKKGPLLMPILPKV